LEGNQRPDLSSGRFGCLFVCFFGQLVGWRSFALFGRLLVLLFGLFVSNPQRNPMNKENKASKAIKQTNKLTNQPNKQTNKAIEQTSTRSRAQTRTHAHAQTNNRTNTHKQRNKQTQIHTHKKTKLHFANIHAHARPCAGQFGCLFVFVFGWSVAWMVWEMQFSLVGWLAGGLIHLPKHDFASRTNKQTK
jgi:hypothetical protein